ncbi:DUF262 domain-containing protein [Crocosphaera sp. XPORK-15E]|uniref:DUF262 domain-containing protein n=1 Tax=Crocosphaera sp. XPORK-15E TaxID=3110247 RepID=UPI002B21F697|nr:DUF262 domain-containing protein [Crocosphaera sp. XPORK-15E]MEA5534448.1 DUF262 domain-containing protein [Crocosphaera sp. XPORK-15E]
MQASETKLQQIIEGTKQYIIPLFQRAYSWKKKEWQDLWDDILELCNTENPRPHFMGSIVTIPTTSVPEGVTKYLLIDGQQRLTTVFILLAALRDRATQSKNENLAAQINNTLLVNPYNEGLEKYKIQPTQLQLDRENFYQIIDNQSKSKESNISLCYLFFEKKIQQSKLELSKIKNIICSSFFLVSVVLGIDDDPYRVFESLNAKGKPLTQADLIRNYFFMLIPTDEQESIYRKYWEPMQALLKDNLTEFIRHYLIKKGIEVRENEIYVEIKAQINDKNAVEYLQSLYKFSQNYGKLLNPEQEQKENIRYYLHRLNRLEVTTIYPFLLNCYDDWMQAKITEKDFIDILKILENFILRRFVCNVQTRGLNRIFALLYAQVSKETNLASDSFIERLKLALQSRDYPKDQEFKDRLMEVKLYGNNRSKKTKLILESIEAFYKHKEPVSFDDLSIEHIMPQKLSQWWKQHLGEDWAITHELWVHSLGNLTLTGFNSELSNDDFITKRSHFKNNSHVELNKYFEDQQSWCKEDIEKRAEYLADIALQIWNYFGDESAPPPQVNNITGKTPKLLTIFGQEFSVRTWRDVLEVTLNKIADVESDRFKDIIEQFPRFVGWDNKDFHSTRKLQNGAFINVNLSAKDINNFCHKALETVEISREEWQLETVEKS